MNILVTGATGFVGRALLTELIEKDHQVTVMVRAISEDLPQSVKQIEIGDLRYLYAKQPYATNFADLADKRSTSAFSANEKLNLSLDSIEVVIHAAGQVRTRLNNLDDSLKELRHINTYPTLKLAKQAAQSGVKRFIFISTIKVNGETTEYHTPFLESDDCRPTDPYAISKCEAEQGLMQVARETGMEVLIIRPPLIYGPGVKGNFASMMKYVRIGIPLPFATVKNKRSLLALDNFNSFIINCLANPKASNQVFLLSDNEDVSTAELLRKLAAAEGKNARLLPVPVSWMKFAAHLFGKIEVAQRLFGSLQVDCTKACYLLDWKPIVSMDEQISKIRSVSNASK